ncbi:MULTISPECIES: hypothetical protein [Paenibacillus]|jgi:hypothetical protein|uniref:hypothetical protein n=1 Tax=Paenibacillus TaxID=44249 RepID=UPI0015BF44DF|nr:hypothetical protein [Paenibacillus odorifer]
MQKVGFETQSSQPKKIKYVTLQKTNESMNASEKEGVNLWNLMVTTLRNNNLMEDKK